MDIVFNSILAIHVLGGSAGLIAGTINLIRKKGDRNHKLVGKVFLYGMLAAGCSSLILASMHPNYFLFIVGVFTVYLVSTGNRYLYLKRLGADQRPGILDQAITIAMLIAGVTFIVFGGKDLLTGKNFGIVLIVFGALGLRFVKTDFDNFKGKAKEKNYWLLVHLQRMTGAYIAALTAFLVVNAKYFPGSLPAILFWLLPTAVLTPLIIRWSRRHKRAVA